MQGKFIHWWWCQLFEIAPFLSLWAGSEKAERCLVQIDGSEAEVLRTQNGKWNSVRKIDLSATNGTMVDDSTKSSATSESGVVSIPDKLILRKHLTVPIAAERNLRSVLLFQLDKISPFKPDDVYFDSVIASRDTRLGQLHIELAIVDRQDVERYLAMARRAGVDPQAAVSLSGARKEKIGFRFVENIAPTKVPQLLKYATRGLAVVVLLLAVTVVGLPYYLQQVERTAVQARLVETKRLAVQASELKAAAKKLRTQRQYAAGKKSTTTPPMIVLLELTQRIPDGTWINQLSMKDSSIKFQGFTPSSESLLVVLEKSARFEQVALKAKVTKDAASGLERVQVSLRTTGDGP